MRTSALRLYPANRLAFPSVRSRQTPLPLSQVSAAPLFVAPIRTSSCQRRASEAPASNKAGRAIAVITDWAAAVAKQRRHGITCHYYSPPVPSTTPRTCHSDGPELGPYQPGSMLGPARVCAGGSMSVLKCPGALTV